VLEVTIVPPGVEVSIPVGVEAIEATWIGVRVHLFVGLVEEVVQLVAAVVVAASFTWAWLFALVSL
jgi:hypothetical protein